MTTLQRSILRLPPDASLPWGRAGSLRAWRALRAEQAHQSLSSDPEHFSATLAALGASARAWIAGAGDPEKPLALIVGRESRRRLSAAVGYAGLPSPSLRVIDIVHGGALMSAHKDAAGHAAQLMIDALTSHGADAVVVNMLPSASSLLPEIRRRAAAVRASVFVGRAHAHWRLSIPPGGADAVAARFSRKHRYNLRRAERLLCDAAGEDLNLSVCIDLAGACRLNEAAKTIMAQSHLAGVHRSGTGKLWESLTAESARAGRLRGYVLSVGTRPMAYQLGMIDGGTYHLVATAFDQRWADLSPGQVLHFMVMRDLADRGLSTIDYGFGDAPYKQAHADSAETEHLVTILAPTPRAIIAGAVMRAAASVDGALRSAALESGSFDEIRRAWRALLAAARASRAQAACPWLSCGQRAAR